MLSFAWPLALGVLYIQTPAIDADPKQAKSTIASSLLPLPETTLQRDPVASEKHLSAQAPPREAINPREAIKLYQQASNLLSSGSAHLAVPVLQQLIESHPQTALAAIAGLRVAEFQLLDKQPEQTIRTLSRSLIQQLSISEVERIDGTFSVRLDQIAEHAVVLISSEELRSLEQWLTDAPSIPTTRQEYSLTGNIDYLVASQVRSKLLEQVAYRLARNKQFFEALKLLDRNQANLNSSLQRSLEFELPLAVLREAPTEDRVQWVAERIGRQQYSRVTISQAVALRLSLAEAYRLGGKLPQSILQLRELAERLQAISATDVHEQEKLNTERGSTSIAEITNWQATVQLRLVEVLLLLKEFSQARETAETALNQFGEYDQANQFRFLIARCHIARLEFAQAREQLNRVLEQAESTGQFVQEASENDFSMAREAAQALWMCGEVAFLQQDYSAALSHFEQTLRIKTTTSWHPRALWEAGKCHELLGAQANAIAKYRRVVAEYPNSDVTKLAQRRLGQLIELQGGQHNQATETTQTAQTIITR